MEKRVCMYCGEVLAAGATSCARCARVAPAPAADASRDDEHVKLLSIFHYVLAAMLALFGCFPIIHLLMGIVIVSSPESMRDARGQGPPAFFGWFFIAMAAFMILFMWAIAAFTAVAGRKFSRRTGYLYCFVVACIECLFMPFGTILGVFTLVVLMRPSVKSMFR
jgi:hypothetical protein